MTTCAPASPPRSCRSCGCTEDQACIVEVRGILRGCRWVQQDLCSACLGVEKLHARGPLTDRPRPHETNRGPLPS